MKIGMMGFDFSCPNKGCEALTYSFVNILLECCEEHEALELYNYSYSEFGDFPNQYPKVKVIKCRPHLKNPTYWAKMKKEFDQLDCIFDVTYGDGFSDIYGRKWNVITDLAKSIAVHSKAPFVLLPQTYGPYYNNILKKWAEYIVKGCTVAYSRDADSAMEMNERCNNKVIALTDMAFALPYDTSIYSFNSEKIKVGINISSLLWDSNYAKENKFKMTVEYRDYIHYLVKRIISIEGYEIHLIPHVIDDIVYEAPENDVRACDIVKKGFPVNSVIVAPAFKTPIEAKSYISNMNVFIGARMHSTIGALSSGVATIPFSYSKKFEGLFGNLNYPYVIAGRKLTTEEAIDKSLYWINKSDELQAATEVARKQIEPKLQRMREDIKSLLKTRMRY